MITEEQLNINSTETKLLYDVRSELREIKNVLCSIAKGAGPKKEVKSKVVVKPKTTKSVIKDKPKRGNKNGKIK